jgi:hypothetical protein
LQLWRASRKYQQKQTQTDRCSHGEDIVKGRKERESLQLWEEIPTDRNIRYFHRKWSTEGERDGRGCRLQLWEETVGTSTFVGIF